MPAQWEKQHVFVWVWSRGTGRHNEAKESMPRGRCVRVERVHTQRDWIWSLHFIQTGLLTFFATDGEVHLPNDKHIKCACAKQLRSAL